MLASVRVTLNSWSKSTKQLILKTTMVVLLCLGVLFIYISTSSYSESPANSIAYSEYLSHYRQKYISQQSQYRKFAFYQTHDELVFQQKQLDERFKQGLNNFTKLTEPEFKQLYKIVTSIAKEKGFTEIAEFQDNYFYDWQEFIPPVKNMKDYDGSFIFAAVASAEFELNKQQVLYYRSLNQTLERGKNWIRLAEQEVIDCCPHCLEKQRPEYVYKHIFEHGLSREETYPYVSSIFHSKPGECKTTGTPSEFKIKSWNELNGCQALNERLAFGPVVVHVDAREWRDYKGGILTSCGSVRNHYAVLVGRGIGYWKIRNSWGPLWGEHGHIKIKSGNTCGICGRSSFVNVE